MNSSKSFFISVTLHASLASLAWMTYAAIKKIPHPEVRIAISLQTLPTIEPKNVPKPSPIVQQIPIKPKEIINKPQITPTPIPPAPVIAPLKPIAASVPVPVVVQTPQAPIKVPTAEPIIAKAPAPSEPKKEYQYPHSQQIVTILNDRKIYPKMAKRLNQQGETLITFELTPQGEAKNIRIKKSSGWDLLDDAAKNLVMTSALLFPKPAENVPVTVPIEFTLH